MGEAGEIIIRSPFSFRGYLQKESAGMTISDDGWIKTGDAGSLHGNSLKVYGKKSNVILRGIKLIYPMVVEREMIKFPGISKVRYSDSVLFEGKHHCILPSNWSISIFLHQDLTYFNNLKTKHVFTIFITMALLFVLLLRQLPSFGPL